MTGEQSFDFGAQLADVRARTAALEHDRDITHGEFVALGKTLDRILFGVIACLASALTTIGLQILR